MNIQPLFNFTSVQHSTKHCSQHADTALFYNFHFDGIRKFDSAIAGILPTGVDMKLQAHV